MASGAKPTATTGSMTVMPMVRTRKNVPMNSTRYFFIRMFRLNCGGEVSKKCPACERKFPAPPLLHVFYEFVGPRDGLVHLFDEPADFRLDAGGLALERRDGLGVQVMLEVENVVVELPQHRRHGFLGVHER